MQINMIDLATGSYAFVDDEESVVVKRPKFTMCINPQAACKNSHEPGYTCFNLTSSSLDANKYLIAP